MEPLILLTFCLYVLSTAGYVAYLFVQKDRLYRAGFGLMLAGFAVHTATLVYGVFHWGGTPVQNLHQTLLFSGWAIAGVFIVFQHRYRLKVFGIYAAPLAAMVVAAASRLPTEPSVAKGILNNVWLVFHIGSIFLGEAAFALACGLGILYLFQEHAIKTKNHGFVFKRLPSLELLDHAGYACIVAGFTLVTVGLITGFIYAKALWGRFWSWDPKEVWSGVTWLFYAALLHQRLTVGWRGRKAAVWAIVGFAAVLFTFLGVNFLFKGHHGEFTRF